MVPRLAALQKGHIDGKLMYKSGEAEKANWRVRKSPYHSQELNLTSCALTQEGREAEG